ncbi:MAG: acyl-ACP--UDP-N-acetylglucosamine O-acyltransferase [Deltaproteobacteria bacterium]|nr:acyl-ACP--UDP-N-acetylglucosamine O-acyltransferase [Deltaproteobacteria bacterium]
MKAKKPKAPPRRVLAVARPRRCAAVKTPAIHSSAVVASSAELAHDVSVGPYAIIGPRVRIGAGSSVGAHAVIEGHTTIGAGNQIFQFAAVGALPQDLKYRGEDSELIIGDRNIIREFATLHPGTSGGGMVTRVGNGNLLMAYTHVAHDCIVGNNNIVANGAQLGGHVIVGDYAVIGALVGILQFTTIGESVMLGGGAMVALDVPPFCNATGDRAVLHGLNTIGLHRRGFSEETIAALKQAYRIMFRSGLKVAEAAQRIRAEVPGAEVERFVAFIEASKHGVCRERGRAAGGDSSSAA